MFKRIGLVVLLFMCTITLGLPVYGGSTQKEMVHLVDLANYKDKNSNSKEDGVFIVTSYDMGKMYKELMEKAKKIKKGTLHVVDTISVKNINSIVIDTELCGLVLEESNSNQIKVSYIGENPEQFYFDSKVVQNTLKLTAKGKAVKERYINIYEKKRYNTYVIQIPSKSVGSIKIEEGVGVTMFTELGIPINASTKQGSLRVYGNKLTSHYTMNSTQGWIAVDVASVFGSLKIKTTQGWIDLNADSISGSTDLLATQGWITVNTKKLGKANLQATQGWIEVNTDFITADAKIIAKQGWVDLAVKKPSANMTINLPKKSWDVYDFPSGWRKKGKDSYEIGNGKPIVDIDGDFVDLKVK